MLEGLKQGYHTFLSPALWVFKKTGVTPNQLTLAGVAIFGIGAWVVYIGHWKISVAIILVGAFLDGCDGQLARQTGRITRFGGILDSVCDRLTEIIWLLGFMGYYLTHPQYPSVAVYLCFAAITGSLMVSYVKARCEGAGVKCSEGLMQRPERITLLCACSLAGPAVMIWGLAALTVLAYYTMVQRLVAAGRDTLKS